jgi:hypothetical protein
MRFTKLAVLAALAIMLRPTGAAVRRGASRPCAVRADRSPVAGVGGPQRAVLACARQDVELRAEDWNLDGLMEGMAGGIVPGLVIGAIVGAATAEDGFDGMTGILTGGILGIGIGIGIGMGVGGIVYTVRRL